MKKTLLRLVAVPLIVLLGCADKDKQDTESLLERHTVTEVTLRDVITQTGEIRPVIKVDLQSEAGGVIKKLDIKEGQAVKKGQRILTIDPERLENRKKTLDLSVAESKIRLDQVRRNYENASELFKTGSISRREQDDLKTQLDLADISYQRQQLELEDIQTQLRKTILVAPMSGVITQMNVDEGEIVTSATSGMQNPTNVGTIADIQHLEVITQIGEVDFVNLKIGQRVVLKPEANPGAQTMGTITFISLTAKRRDNNELGTFDVRASVDSIIAGIVPGINVNVEFVILEKKGVLGVPCYFVKKRRDKAMVLVSSKEKGVEVFKPTDVTLGISDFKNCEIIAGLTKGDEVIFKPDSVQGKKPPKRSGGGPGSGPRH